MTCLMIGKIASMASVARLSRPIRPKSLPSSCIHLQQLLQTLPFSPYASML